MEIQGYYQYLGGTGAGHSFAHEVEEWKPLEAVKGQ